MHLSPKMSAWIERARANISVSDPEQKMETFRDACYVLGHLTGGGCMSLEEARQIALGLARESDFPADSIEWIAVMEILEGKKHPMAFR